MGHPARLQELRSPCQGVQHHWGCIPGDRDVEVGMFSGVKDQKQWLPFVPAGWNRKVLPRDSLHAGDIADLVGSISELFVWCRWKRELDRACVCLLAQSWGGTGVALPQGMLKPGCYSWCVPGCGAVVQATAGRELRGCCTARRAGWSRSCMAAFSSSVHGGERFEAASGLNYVNLGIF